MTTTELPNITVEQTRLEIVEQDHILPGMEIHTDTFFHGRDVVSQAHRRNLAYLAARGYATPTQYGYILDRSLWMWTTARSVAGVVPPTSFEVD